jgi:type I restriction enzyme M protein
MVDVFHRQLELPGYSRMVTLAEIEANDYNLNIPRYIDGSEAEDLHDIAAHLLGGIPDYDIEALDEFWQVFPSLKRQLFAASGRPGYSQLKLEAAQLKAFVSRHTEFLAYTETINALFAQWRQHSLPLLASIGPGSHPRQLIDLLAEDLLQVFAPARLVDKYDVYQHLMSYWSETMQDDVYLLAQDGWLASEDLIPAPLLIARYFAAEQAAIETLEAQRDESTRKLEELDEEHGGEGGLLEEAKNEKGKLTRASIKARQKDLFGEPDTEDERAMLNSYLTLLDQEAEASSRVRSAQKALDAQVTAKYHALSEDEVKGLVIDDKWLATLSSAVQGELNRVSQALTGRVTQLAERYASPLPELMVHVEALSSKVDAHLRRMSFVW